MSQSDKLKLAGRIGPLLVALVLIGAGCGQKAASPTGGQNAPTGQVQPETAKPGQMKISADCEHPYFPLNAGHEIDYAVNSNGQVTTWSMKVMESTGQSGKLQFKVNEPKVFTINQNITCVGGNLSTDGFLDMAEALGGQVKITTKSVEGEIMPKDLAVGRTWTTKYVTETEMTGGGALGQGKFDSLMEVANQVVAEENVTVPAGTYKALKIEQTTKATTTINMPQMSKPITQENTTKATQWWVAGVGLVKQVTPSPQGDAVQEATQVIK